MLSRLRRTNAALDRWLRDHVLVWWLLFAAVPAGAFAASEVLLGDGSTTGALVLGAVFGATFATVTVAVQRWRGP